MSSRPPHAAAAACPRCGAAAAPGARFCPACGAPLPAAPPGGAEAPAAADLRARVAEALGEGYEVLGEVGRGGMAVVFLAWDRGLARHAAVKVLRPALSEDPAMARRFLQEGRTAAGLDAHPGVVRVYAAHEARGLRYLAMRYVDGCSLDALLRARGPLPPDLAADVVDQLARALHYAHARGVVHRDVKPANVLLARDGTAALTDFGIASAAANDTLGRGGSGLGTPAYMSPEHWRDEPLTPAGDQYALGVVAHQLAAGRLPFGGSLYAMQQAHLYEPPPALAEGDAGGALRAYAAVAARMLAKAPGDRFPSLGAVADALAAVPRDEPAVLRVRVGRLVRAVAAAAEQEAASPAANGRAPDTEAAPPDPARAAFLEAGTVPMPRAALRPDAEDAAEAHTPAVVDDPVPALPPASAPAPTVREPAVQAPPPAVRAPVRPRRALVGAAAAVAVAAAGWAVWPRPSPQAAPARSTPRVTPGPVTSGPPVPSGPAASPPGPSTPAPPVPATDPPAAPSAAPPSPADPSFPARREAPAPDAAAPRRPTPTPRSAPAPAARPSDAEVRQAVRQLVATVRARDTRALAARLAPRAGDGTPARDFLVWLRRADRLAFRAAPTRGGVVVRGRQARVAVRVPFQWRAAVGPVRWTVRRDAVFWLTLAPDGARWRGRGVTLAGRFPP